MSTPFNPDDWIDLLAYLIIGLPALVAAIAAVRNHKKVDVIHANQKLTSDEILYEVRNDHRTNLRDDIDNMSKAINEGFIEVRRELHGIRSELNTERVARIEGDRQRY